MVKYDPTQKQRGKEKMARIPIKIEPSESVLPKPYWIRIRSSISPAVPTLKALLRKHKLHSVCEEASCPNLNECFSHGTATFMIMGDKCTRRCTFCDVGHGRPDPLDSSEPNNLSLAIKDMQLKYVVITSVDRDDLRDGGAMHFAECIKAIRIQSPNTQIEILVPDFRGRMELALDNLSLFPPDVFNHNVETVPRLYKAVRPGSDFIWSLTLIKNFKQRFPSIPTKSGLMLGLGETNEEIKEVLNLMREYNCDRLTLGQYLQPSKFHSPVDRYVSLEEFKELGDYAKSIGFNHVASGPLVRSSYHADLQAMGEEIS
ncbi:MAG: lipA [Francisellaceae bacterium]|nr:lipA [Francisellaceae bacterium]